MYWEVWKHTDIMKLMLKHSQEDLLSREPLSFLMEVLQVRPLLLQYDDRLVSYFSRLNYDYNEKYHISLSLRTDGSSRFADTSRWGIFYSVGGAWNIK